MVETLLSSKVDNAFGFANAVYIAFNILSNLMLGRIGARSWIAVLVVAWGIASICTLFARDEHSLYLLRIGSQAPPFFRAMIEARITLTPVMAL